LNFLESANNEAVYDKNLYGECYRLPKMFDSWDTLDKIETNDLNSFGKAGKGGVHIVHKQKLIEIGGYDEFYCYWGVEDRDLNHRLTKLGLLETWMNKQAPVFHQWHPLTSDFYASGFPLQWWEDMNIYFERNKSKVVRNGMEWGKLLTKKDRPVLNENFPVKNIKLECENSIFAYNGKTNTIKFIFDELGQLKPGLRICFVWDDTASQHFLKYVPLWNFFSNVIISKKKWNEIIGFTELYYRRMNHFIPKDDLRYIFCDIARNDKWLDFSFQKKGSAYEWYFALRDQ
jgi:hypothetical protein